MIKVATKIAALTCVPIIAVLSLLPKEELVRTGAAHSLEHFGAYAGAAFLAVVAFGRSRQAATAIAVAYVAAAGVFEFLQHWSPGRDANLPNFFQSGCGAIVGVLVGLWFTRRLKFLVQALARQVRRE